MYSFEKSFKDLPSVVPLFPLNKVLLLPRAKLPLNLFETRYLYMLDYSLSNGRCIGMVQPNQSINSKKNPSIYQIGCAGYITAFSQTHDNRYEIILKGLSRFFIKSELKLHNGFRRANVEWKQYKDDFKIGTLKSKKRREDFLNILKIYLKKISITADWQAVQVSSDEDLVNSIAMGCPFDQNEKQALLQANSLDERLDILISLINIALNSNEMNFSDSEPS
ncbi:MAG: hypothetical protein CMM95_02675 [Rickettsiales bacterium]|nr:hypothetical protein [Rickettsiales bacterium]|tara:strand:+ start:911 stop:1576 length:666 start_codon:yes stop_codon:yes gene_type:complete